MIWKNWAPPKVKFFAWLALQDRIWTADRLAKRGWKNCGLCPLCKREPETGPHLFFKCRHTIRLWSMLVAKLGLEHVDISTWRLPGSVEEWWDRRAGMDIPSRKAMASLIMLVSWTLWNERNARVYRRKSTPLPILLNTTPFWTRQSYGWMRVQRSYKKSFSRVITMRCCKGHL